MLTLSEQAVPRVLSALRRAGAPAYAAPAQPAARRLGRRAAQPSDWELWVGSSAYGEAESALLALMPSLSRESAQRDDTAWR